MFILTLNPLTIDTQSCGPCVITHQQFLKTAIKQYWSGVQHNRFRFSAAQENIDHLYINKMWFQTVLVFQYFVCYLWSLANTQTTKSYKHIPNTQTNLIILLY